MSILIKGMEMPKACEWCSFISTFTTESGLGCRCEVEKFEFWDYSKRQENCPLVEVPTPHGRLIDVDELFCKIDGIKGWDYGDESDMAISAAEALSAVDDSPTVIEAEE